MLASFMRKPPRFIRFRISDPLFPESRTSRFSSTDADFAKQAVHVNPELTRDAWTTSPIRVLPL